MFFLLQTFLKPYIFHWSENYTCTAGNSSFTLTVKCCFNYLEVPWGKFVICDCTEIDLTRPPATFRVEFCGKRRRSFVIYASKPFYLIVDSCLCWSLTLYESLSESKLHFFRRYMTDVSPSSYITGPNVALLPWHAVFCGVFVPSANKQPNRVCFVRGRGL